MEAVIAPGASMTDVGGSRVVRPDIGLFVRYGVGHSTDVGLKLFPLGGSADINITLVDVERFSLSLDPVVSLATFFVADTTFVGFSAWLPVLMDVWRSKLLTVTLGPRVGVGQVIGGADNAVPLAQGVAIGASMSARFKILPELALTPEVSLIHVFGQASPAITGALGMSF